jgi:phage-related protein
MPTFAPPVNPSASTSVASQPVTLSVEYGDGYRQAATVGINADRRKATVNWTQLSRTDADTIVAFLEARLGYESFDYALPPSTTSRKWVCKTWNRIETTSLIVSISANFDQVFDL